MTTVINGTSTSASAPAVVGDDGDTGVYFPSANTLALSAGGTQVSTINAYGIGLGAGTTPSSGMGITFPASQSASSDANTLDDYEEGTWTPIASAQSGSLTSYSSAGQYTKVGRNVFLTGYVTLTNVGTASGWLIINGLPFVSLNIANGRPAVFVARENASNGLVYSGWSDGGTTTMNISNLTFSAGIAWTNNFNYSFTLTYQSTS